MESSAQILAANTLAFLGHDLRAAFRAIRAAGYSHVEPAFISTYDPDIDDRFFSPARAREVRKLAAHYELHVIAVSAHIDRGHSGAVDSFRRRMDFARTLGARYVHTNSTTRERSTSFLRNLERLLPHAAADSLIITLENPGDGDSSLIGCGREGAALVRSIGSENLRLNYDPSNAFSFAKGTIDAEADLESALPCCAHLHLKQLRQEGNAWRFAPIGPGATDYVQMLRLLSRQPCRLPMSIELPLRYVRGSDFSMLPLSGRGEPPIDDIQHALRTSRDFILATIPVSEGPIAGRSDAARTGQ